MAMKYRNVIPTAYAVRFSETVWHVYSGGHFVGAWDRETAESVVEAMNAEKGRREAR